MSYSYTVSQSTTFTITHAKYIASKVATDLKRIQRFYGNPSDAEILDYESEVVQLLKSGYLGTVTYGFKKDGKWIEPTLKYMASDLIGTNFNDDDPGKIRPNVNILGASFHSYLTYSSAWDNLSVEARQAFKNQLPFQRGSGLEPGVEGYYDKDLTYYSGSRALHRSSVRSFL
jgi:Bacterial HORMA domain family 1